MTKRAQTCCHTQLVELIQVKHLSSAFSCIFFKWVIFLSLVRCRPLVIFGNWTCQKIFEEYKQMKHSSTSIYDSIKQVGVDLGCPTLLAGLLGVRAAEYFEPVSNSIGLNLIMQSFQWTWFLLFDGPKGNDISFRKHVFFQCWWWWRSWGKDTAE